MNGRIGVPLAVGVIALLATTCGGGGSPTDPGLEQAAGGQGQGNSGIGDPSGENRCPTPGNATKTLICHLPPGNPDNARELCVDDSGVTAHLEHGDYLGECVECAAGDPYCCAPGDPYCAPGPA